MTMKSYRALKMKVPRKPLERDLEEGDCVEELAEKEAEGKIEALAEGKV
jgi:hypothetical protein